jgi:hypothetical protein
MDSEKRGEHAARTMKKKIVKVPDCRSATIGGDGGGSGGRRLKYWKTSIIGTQQQVNPQLRPQRFHYIE